MKEIDNDKLLRDFFATHQLEIADAGFSRRVMHHLPDRTNRLAHLWSTIVMAIGLALFVGLGGMQAAWGTIREVFISMINHGVTHVDPKSMIIAMVVLLFLATKKVVSLA